MPHIWVTFYSFVSIRRDNHSFTFNWNFWDTQSDAMCCNYINWSVPNCSTIITEHWTVFKQKSRVFLHMKAKVSRFSVANTWRQLLLLFCSWYTQPSMNSVDFIGFLLLTEEKNPFLFKLNEVKSCEWRERKNTMCNCLIKWLSSQSRERDNVTIIPIHHIKICKNRTN